MKITKKQLLDGACDLYGYSISDFNGMSTKDIIKYIGIDKTEDIKEYSN